VQNVWWGQPLPPEILGQSDRVGAKSRLLRGSVLWRPNIILLEDNILRTITLP